MLKLTLMSVAIAVVVIPLLVASDPNPKRGLKRALAGFIAFNFFFVFLVRVVVPRLSL